MINILLGPPGGGKSYEAVAFHVIPALSAGRKVITNLPLVEDNFPPEWRMLLDIRKTVGLVRPFSVIDHFGDDWRHPEKGFGALYVIDECHYPLRRGKTPQAIQEWFSEHRHELCDVLLMSQSYGKVDKEICDMVQTMYRVKKGIAFGFSGHYIRKVYDGINGDCVNTGQRKYEKRFFKYYRSHTKSAAAGQEQAASDIVPIWKRWPFLLAPVFLVSACTLFMKNGVNPVDSMAPKKLKESKQVIVEPQARASMSTPKDQQLPTHPEVTHEDIQTVETKATKSHPLDGYGVHIGGFLSSAKKGTFYLFTVSQNGQFLFTMNEDEIKKAGYRITYQSECVAVIAYEGMPDRFAICDAPRIGMSPGSNIPTSAKI